MVSERPSEWSHFGPGSRIGKYVLEHQIGHGGMAVVFRAREDQLGRAHVRATGPTIGSPSWAARGAGWSSQPGACQVTG
jgi:hypothetical protein